MGLQVFFPRLDFQLLKANKTLVHHRYQRILQISSDETALDEGDRIRDVRASFFQHEHSFRFSETMMDRIYPISLIRSNTTMTVSGSSKSASLVLPVNFFTISCALCAEACRRDACSPALWLWIARLTSLLYDSPHSRPISATSCESQLRLPVELTAWSSGFGTLSR